MKEKWKNNDDLFMKKLINFKVKCQKCGHTIILIDRESCICNWCGEKVYRSKKDEFKDKLKKKIK